MPAPRIARPAADEHIAYYGRYITLVPGDDAWPALEFQLDETLKLLRPLDEKTALHRYQPGKWSVKEVVGHLIDAERVFAYRALRMARGDRTPLAGFEQDDYVARAGSDRRTLLDLADELAHLRAANLSFFRALEPEAWERTGTASDNPFVVCAFPFILAGHERHHRRILAERYLSG